MIATVTLNPAIDRTVTVDTLRPGALNRIKRVRLDASGKGINVSKALLKFGISSVALGFLGGTEGQFIEADVRNEGIKPSFTWLQQESTRVNVKVVEESSGDMTELNEPGPRVGEEDLGQFFRDLSGQLENCQYLVCSGSLPPGVPDDTYAQMVTLAKESGVHCILDASGTSLRKGIARRPFMIKPNKYEAAEILGRPLERIEDVKEAVIGFMGDGIQVVVISLGADGAVFGSPDGVYWARAGVERVHSTAGCGDALVAATVAGIAEGKSWPETVRFAAAVAAATATTEGTSFPSPQMIKDVLARVQMEELARGVA